MPRRPIAYVSFTTFLDALDLLKGTPLDKPLDRRTLGDVSNATWHQLRHTLRFLGLLTDQHVPTASLKALVQAKNRKPALTRLLKKYYTDLFRPDLTHINLGQLDRFFSKYGVKHATLRKARSFLIRAARYSEIPLSPDLLRVSRGQFNTKNRRHFRPELINRLSKTSSGTAANLTVSISFNLTELNASERKQLFRWLEQLALLSHREEETTTKLQTTDASEVADLTDKPFH